MGERKAPNPLQTGGPSHDAKPPGPPPASAATASCSNRMVEAEQEPRTQPLSEWMRRTLEEAVAVQLPPSVMKGWKEAVLEEGAIGAFYAGQRREAAGEPDRRGRRGRQRPGRLLDRRDRQGPLPDRPHRDREGQAQHPSPTGRRAAEEPAAGRGGKVRWSARRRMTVVLELLRKTPLPLSAPGAVG